MAISCVMDKVSRSAANMSFNFFQETCGPGEEMVLTNIRTCCIHLSIIKPAKARSGDAKQLIGAILSIKLAAI